MMSRASSENDQNSYDKKGSNFIIIVWDTTTIYYSFWNWFRMIRVTKIFDQIKILKGRLTSSSQENEEGLGTYGSIQGPQGSV